MDFTDAYRLTRKGVQHGFAYSPGSTFLATLHHLSDHDGLGLAMSSRHSSDGQRDAWRCSSSSSSGYGRSGGNDEKQQQRGCTLVQIRASSTLQVVRSWSLPFLSTAVRWSQDGTMLLLAGKNRFLVLVVDPRLAPTVRASIAPDLGDDLQHDCLLSVKAGAEGMGAVSWIGGDAICSFSSDHLTATMWDVRSGRTTVTASTKTSRCYASPSNDHIAFLLRKDAADTAAILAHNSSHDANTASATFPAPWRTIEEFFTQTNDAIGLCWSPDERHVAVWEGILEHKLLIFSVLGHLQATLSIEVMHPQTAIPTIAEPIGHPSLSAGGLGIREVRWSPNGRFIAIGDYDDHVRLLETREWCECASFDVSKLAAKTSSRNGCEAVSRTSTPGSPARLLMSPTVQIGWREPAAWLQHTGGRSIVGCECTCRDALKYTLTSPMFQLNLCYFLLLCLYSNLTLTNSIQERASAGWSGMRQEIC